jgi:hypothetical protein
MSRHPLAAEPHVPAIRVALSLAVAIVAVALCAPSFAQTNTGRILGTVQDSTGAVVIGASVSITDTQRGASRTLTTDTSGNYVAPNLQPGFYTIKVSAKGFANVERPSVQLEVARDVRLDFTLQPGQATETISVTTEVPLVDTTSSTLGGTISNMTINDMPLNGRNFQKLVELRPGIYITPGGGKWSQTTNGLRVDHNVYILNGIDTIEGFSAQSVMNGTGIYGDASSILPIDAIQEFNVQQNPKAEYGWKPGGIVNVGLKSGTNTFHGTAYAFGRDSAMDATNPFIAKGQPKQQTAIEQFGGTAGGRIIKDKLFYMGGYEGSRSLIGAPQQQVVPTTASLGGGSVGLANSLTDACKSLTSAQRNPLSLKMAGLDANCAYVSPKDNIFQDTASQNYLTIGSADMHIDNWLAKMDYVINPKNSLFGEYFIGNFGGLVPQGGPVHDYFRTYIGTRAQIAGFHWNWVPSSSIVNEARVGFNRTYQPSLPGDCQDIGQPDFSYLHTGATSQPNVPYMTNKNGQSCGFPLIRGLGSITLGCCVNFPKVQGPDMTYQFVDGLSLSRGKHAFKFGGEMRHLIYNGGTWRGGRGDFRFASSGSGATARTALQNFVAGVPQQGSLFIGSPQRNITDWGYAGYAQDDWRINQRLTINLGLRYEFITVLKDAHNQLANFYPDSPFGVLQVGKGVSKPFAADGNNWSPRVGFAWDMFGSGRTVLRGGASIIYVMSGFNVTISQQGTAAVTTGLNTTPTGGLFNGVQGPGDINAGSITLQGSQLNWSLAGPIFPNASAITCTTAAPCPILAVDPNLRSPYVAAWNLSVQHALTRSLGVEAAYVGNHSTKLTSIVDINAAAPGSGWATALATNSTTAARNTTAENQSRPYFSKFPYLSNINQMRNADEGNYDALQATLSQHPWHGITYTLGYTWAHTLDMASADWNTNVHESQLNPHLDYGNGNFDIRHRMTIALTYQLPERHSFAQLLQGWKLNSVVNLQTARPWSVLDSTTDVSGTGELADRWNFFGSASDFSGLKANTVPFFPGVTNSACQSKAASLGPAAVNSLTRFGCFATGSSMMLPAALGTFGNMPRNIFRGTGLKLWDLSLTKKTSFTERLSGEFRVEAFNILNHVQYGGPKTNPGTGASSGFGSTTVTPDVDVSNPQVGSGAARSIQLAFKLIF